MTNNKTSIKPLSQTRTRRKLSLSAKTRLPKPDPGRQGNTSGTGERPQDATSEERPLQLALIRRLPGVGSTRTTAS